MDERCLFRTANLLSGTHTYSVPALGQTEHRLQLVSLDECHSETSKAASVSRAAFIHFALDWAALPDNDELLGCELYEPERNAGVSQYANPRDDRDERCVDARCNGAVDCQHVTSFLSHTA
jgi:hypothetical protein